MTVGVGFEWKFADYPLSLRTEYRFTDLDHFNNNDRFTCDGCEATSGTATTRTSISSACCSPSTGALVALEKLQQLLTDPKSLRRSERVLRGPLVVSGIGEGLERGTTDVRLNSIPTRCCRTRSASGSHQIRQVNVPKIFQFLDRRGGHLNKGEKCHQAAFASTLLPPVLL